MRDGGWWFGSYCSPFSWCVLGIICQEFEQGSYWPITKWILILLDDHIYVIFVMVISPKVSIV